MTTVRTKTIKILVIGFIFGSIILPFLNVLGLVIPYLEYLRPLLKLGLWVTQPFIVHVDANTSYLPAFAWVMFGVTNGLFYSLIFATVYFVFKKLSIHNFAPSNDPDPRA